MSILDVEETPHKGREHSMKRMQADFVPDSGDRVIPCSGVEAPVPPLLSTAHQVCM